MEWVSGDAFTGSAESHTTFRKVWNWKHDPKALNRPTSGARTQVYWNLLFVLCLSSMRGMRSPWSVCQYSALC